MFKNPKKTCLVVAALVIGAFIVITLIGVIVGVDPASEVSSSATQVPEEPSPTPNKLEETSIPTLTVQEPLPTAQITEEPSATPSKPDDNPIPTPTADEALSAFVLCDRLRANLSMLWGQAPGIIYSGDPRVTGEVEEGDYVRFLMSEPNANGEIRIKVFPHDYRAVGNSNDQVWIDWDGLLQFRLDQVMFTCES